MQRRDEAPLGKIQKRESSLQVILDPVPLLRLQTIPLIDNDQQGAATLQYMPRQGGVLFADTLLRIQDQQHHIGLFDGLQRLDDTEFLDRLVDPGPAPHPRRIDKRVGPLVTGE